MSGQGGGQIHGHCGCGLLRYTIDTSDIERDLGLSAYCHCSSCQRLNGAPFVWTTHWAYRAVTWDPPAASGSSLPPGITAEAAASPPDSEKHDEVNGEGPSSSSSTTTTTTTWHSPNMQTFESMKGRKWKLRCRHCGSPLGSWNARTTRWTIWPTTLKRKSTSSGDPGHGPANNDGQYDVPDDTLLQIKPRHHQFYGPWRTIDMHDDLDKWTGYEGKSDRVDALGQKRGGTE